MEYEDALGLNLYEMGLRSYDPAIGRFNGIDPVTHFSQGTSVAFDNNPILFADPSGADAQWGALWLLNASLGDDDNDREWEDNLYHNHDNITNKENETVQTQPEKLDFVNAKSKKEKEGLLDNAIEWFGHIDKYGNKSINVGSIINFYAEPKKKNEKSMSETVLDYLEDIIGGDSSDHNNITLSDGKGNYVEVGYFNHTEKHASLYSGSSVDFKGEETYVKGVKQNIYRMNIRSHSIGGGNAASVIYMLFTGKDRSYYDQIYDRIKAYKPYKAKIIPYNKK